MTVIEAPVQLSTPRLILRHFQASDLEPFAEMNQCPEVMKYFPSKLTFEQTENFVREVENHFATNGFGLWALELKEGGDFIGFVGLNVPKFEASFTPCVEIGWRIAQKHWGVGYAPEAARKVLKDGFERVKLNEILSWTAEVNKNSIRVMKKIGMIRNPDDDFMHPNVDDGSELKPHVLFRMKRQNYLL